MIFKLAIFLLYWYIRVSTVQGIPGSESCTGVPNYLCNNGSINTNGEGLLDIRIKYGPGLGECSNEGNQTDTSITPAAEKVMASVCGFRHPDGVGFRITQDNGYETQFGEFPWMVAVLNEQAVKGDAKKLNVYQCGGALIHPQMVVTSAHCVTGTRKACKIRAGEWDTQNAEEIYPHQDREIQDIIVHPQFYAGASQNDIAVLYLKTPLEITDNVDTICLPPKGAFINPGTTCYATGWGKDVFGKYSVILKKIDLPIVSNDECQAKLRTTRLGEFFQLHKSFVCAGGVFGKDTCEGDGGSPLVCPIPGKEDRYYQVGIVSWGIGCGQNNTPGVYAKVALFRGWIDAQMKSFSLDTSFYRY